MKTNASLTPRNQPVFPVANPGDSGSRRLPNTFMIRPTAALLAPGQKPDELMIAWGNTPAGSVASIYWPQVSAAQVLQMAASLYTTHLLTMSDSHTLQTPVGGTTYIPIPPGTGATLPGLMTVDLPPEARAGQSFNIVVRQVTGAAQKAAVVRIANAQTWRRVLGSFQIMIAVKTRKVMLAPEERSLSVMRWIQQAIPANDRWFPVIQRYVDQIAERVSGLGGNPVLILPSPNGGGTSLPSGGKSPGPGTRLEFTGKVMGLKYDRFGDFKGFNLGTEQGGEQCFQSQEHEIEALVQRAWAERILITVFADPHEPHRPESIILRSAPRPFQH